MGTAINISITGFVGQQPETRIVGEQQVTSFSVAINRKSGDKKSTLWVRVNCWNKLADIASEYVRKGSLVQVNGEWLRSSAYINQDGKPQASLDIDATRLTLLDRIENGDTPAADAEGGDIPF
jgi:single-strand DNA-binding protein